VLASVATIFWPISPAFPTPVTMTQPRQSWMSRIASQNQGSSDSESLTSESASCRMILRASRSCSTSPKEMTARGVVVDGILSSLTNSRRPPAFPADDRPGSVRPTGTQRQSRFTIGRRSQLITMKWLTEWGALVGVHVFLIRLLRTPWNQVVAPSRLNLVAPAAICSACTHLTLTPPGERQGVSPPSSRVLRFLRLRRSSFHQPTQHCDPMSHTGKHTER